MTFAEIKQLALRQLDMDPADMDEADDLLSAYVNEGYRTALLDYARPRDVFILATDKDGNAGMDALGIRSIIEVTDAESGMSAWATQDALGQTLHTAVRNGKVRVVALVVYPEMEEGDDTPRIPYWAHGALADYACFRFLSNGNMAKQSRAQFYYGRFMTQMERIRPQGMGSVTGLKNLYEATDIRRTR